MPATKTQDNVTVSYNDVDITCFLTNSELAAAAESIDASTYCGNATIADDPDWSFTVDAHWDSTIDAALMPDIITPGNKRKFEVVYTDDASNTVTYTWDPVTAPANSRYATLENGTITGALGSLLVLNGTISLSGTPVRAVA